MKILSNHTVTASNIVFLMADDSTSEKTEMKRWNKVKKQLSSQTAERTHTHTHTPELRGSAHLRNEKCMQVSIAGRRMVSSTEQQHSKKKKKNSSEKCWRYIKKKPPGKEKKTERRQTHYKFTPSGTHSRRGITCNRWPSRGLRQNG